MGQMKTRMMEDIENEDIIDFLSELVRREDISGAILGIAKQVISKGVSSMSMKQKAAIDSYIERYKKENECEVCININITSLNDYIYISDNGICPNCEYSRRKYFKD